MAKNTNAFQASNRGKIISVAANEAAVSTAADCRALGSVGTAWCKTIYFRNPKTTATVVAHLLPYDYDIRVLFPIIRRISNGAPLEVSITSGGVEEMDLERVKHQMNEVHKILDKVKMQKIRLIEKQYDICNQRMGEHTLMELATGEMQYVEESAVISHLVDGQAIKPSLNVVYNGLAPIISR